MLFFYGLFGLLIGSFLNVVILRLGTGRSITRGRSYCFSCSHVLSSIDLVPVFSFLSTFGRCRYCKCKLSPQYPLVELATGILFSLSYYKYSDLSHVLLASLLAIISCLIIIFVYDLRHKIIPDSIVYIFIALSIFWHLGAFGGFSISSLNTLMGPILFSFFALIWLVSRGKWMGFGDAKLVLGIGLLLGASMGLSAMLIAFWSGAIVGIALLFASKHSLTMKSEIPFAPFLILGTLTVLYFPNILSFLNI